MTSRSSRQRHRLFPRTATGQRRHCKEHEPPRDAQRRTEQLAQRFAEFGTAGTRFLEGLLAGNRFGKNQAERVLTLAAAYPRSDVVAALERAVRYGAFSLVASDGSLPCGAGPRRRWMPWPMTIGAIWSDSLMASQRHRGPLPTIKLSWARTLPMPNRSTLGRRPSHPPRSRRARTAAAPNLHGDVTAAVQTLGVGVTPEMA